jgi:hypothetical protein
MSFLIETLSTQRAEEEEEEEEDKWIFRRSRRWVGAAGLHPWRKKNSSAQLYF